MNCGDIAMIYTLTFNPSLDYIMELDSLNPGGMNRASSTRITPGGKGINVSIVLTALGVENSMLGFVAGFTGDIIERELKSSGYDTAFIHLESGLSRINVKLSSNVSTEINAPGPSIGRAELELLYSQLDLLTNEDILVLAGAIPDTLPDYTYQMIVERMNDRGVKTVVDATGNLLLSTLSCHPFLIKPNRQELETLFSCKILLHEDVSKYAGKLIEMGAQNVLVSLDHEGAVLATASETIYVPAPDGNVINPVGAGDSMVAGFLTGWLETGLKAEALKMSVAAGSASAFSSGFASGDDIRTLRRLLR